MRSSHGTTAQSTSSAITRGSAIGIVTAAPPTVCDTCARHSNPPTRQSCNATKLPGSTSRSCTSTTCRSSRSVEGSTHDRRRRRRRYRWVERKGDVDLVEREHAHSERARGDRAVGDADSTTHGHLGLRRSRRSRRRTTSRYRQLVEPAGRSTHCSIVTSAASGEVRAAHRDALLVPQRRRRLDRHLGDMRRRRSDRIRDPRRRDGRECPFGARSTVGRGCAARRSRCPRPSSRRECPRRERAVGCRPGRSPGFRAGTGHRRSTRIQRSR